MTLQDMLEHFSTVNDVSYTSIDTFILSFVHQGSHMAIAFNGSPEQLAMLMNAAHERICFHFAGPEEGEVLQ